MGRRVRHPGEVKQQIARPHRVNVLRAKATRTKDVLGQSSPNDPSVWEVVGQLWARKAEKTGFEREVESRLVGVAHVEWNVPNEALAKSLALNDRIGWDGRTFSVVAWKEHDEEMSVVIATLEER